MTSGTLRRYVPFATSSLQASLQYRADLLVSLLTTSVSTAVVVFLWRAVIGQHPDGALGGFSVAGITTYLLAAQLLTLMHNSKAGEDTSQEIVGGDIAVSLVRPVSYPVSRVFMALPTALTNLVLVGLPLVAIFALLFPMSAPSPLGLALFVLAAVPSVVIAFSVQLLVGMSALITTNTWGVGMVVNSLIVFLSGALVPLDLLPRPIEAIASFLPFQSMVYGPVQLLMERYDGFGEAAQIMLRQGVWAVVMVLVGALVWRTALRRIEVLGG
ncbi:ABC-2 family transporter protein [Streptomyces sp. TRM75563]|uniref:ABC transporter permease n=1 Tax=Streptomyces sp. TRM75563 TaxID=2817418 RepID=UPI001F6034B4|nr:ABC-2 family transporter protein [Streptomyces sp. TRM75563]MCI4042781.1 ABC-2 family transporter protein [Streptomyces sp. TRM75563]